MRILKYIFLLILLAMVALTVFVATQKGEFDVTRTRVINSPRSVIFNYVNDYRNWENWSSLKQEDPEIKFAYPTLTVGKGGSYSWIGREGEGSMQTLFVKENDSIAQKMIYNDAPSQVTWKFMDTIGGTKIIWRAKGRLDFKSKIFSVMEGGAEKMLGSMYDKSLANLDKTLDYEINTYSIKPGGIVMKAGVIYLQQTINSKIINLPKNLQIILSKMTGFFKKNKIPMNGKPFVIYHTYDSSAGLTKFSVCIPLKEEIYTSWGSDITFGRLEPFRAVKVTLNGDYSHRQEAWAKGAEYISDNSLTRGSEIRFLEVLTRSMEETKSPSKWVTDIYIPVREVAEVSAAVPAVRRTPRPVPAAASAPAEAPATAPEP
ncbi:MAG TPA: SRPBCC family protein [Flavobacterium sp.]|jgi:effector-binding domain-containing protein